MAKRIFEERRTYRRYRLMDAARLLPVLGMGLFFGPVFILSGEGSVTGATSGWMIYLFGVWAALVLMAAVLGWAIGWGLPTEPMDRDDTDPVVGAVAPPVRRPVDPD